MKRRNFIKALGATTAVATLGSKRAQADAKKYKWKMVTSWPKNFPGLGVGAENLAKMINDLSGGRIKIKVFWSQ
jgi:TRAP-type mannitol/chloroaromatic compound transport system, periplasmic component